MCQLKTETMKRIHLFLLLLVVILASCGGDKFKIDSDIANLDGAGVRVIFKSDSGLVDEWINLDKNRKFSYQGMTSQPVIVNLLNHRDEPLVAVVASGGDHIKLKGDASAPMGIKVSGNRLNEEWQLFRKEHAAFYTDANPSRLDAAIEKYVKEHPADMLSTVLLIADYSDYSDRAKVDEMFKSIQPEARPESITQAFIGAHSGSKNKKLPRLMTMTLWKHHGAFEEVSLTNRVTLLSLWAQPQKDRDALRTEVQAIQDKTDGKVQVLDILTESDTIRWHQTIDGESWQHYWAPGGPLEQGIQLLGITSMPWYAVTDSTGLIIYSGPSIDNAVNKALKTINK